MRMMSWKNIWLAKLRGVLEGGAMGKRVNRGSGCTMGKMGGGAGKKADLLDASINCNLFSIRSCGGRGKRWIDECMSPQKASTTHR